MTSKRTIENDLGELSDVVLEGLPTDSRLRMLVGAAAADDDEIVERLQETAPRRQYRSMDREYEKRVHMAFDFSLEATYSLHVSYLLWQLQLSELETLAATRPDFYEAVVDGEESVTIGEREAATRLYIDYHAHKQFAEEQLDSSIEEFLGLSRTEFPDLQLADIVEQIEDGGWLQEPVGRHWLLGATEQVDDEPLSLDEAIEVRHAALVEDWEHAKENY